MILFCSLNVHVQLKSVSVVGEDLPTLPMTADLDLPFAYSVHSVTAFSAFNLSIRARKSHWHLQSLSYFTLLCADIFLLYRLAQTLPLDLVSLLEVAADMHFTDMSTSVFFLSAKSLTTNLLLNNFVSSPAISTDHKVLRPYLGSLIISPLQVFTSVLPFFSWSALVEA